MFVPCRAPTPGVPTTGENGVHASASPLEGLAERANWLKADVTADVFGKALLAQGISAETIKVRGGGGTKDVGCYPGVVWGG